MKLFLIFLLLIWTNGLYWFNSKILFPQNSKITKKQIGLILFNQGIHSILLLLLRKCYSKKIFPRNISTLIFYLLLFTGLEEIYFYYTHRLLHKKWFYKNIHYIHHKWKKTFADVALYSHPIEHLINVLCPMVLPILFKNDFVTILLWNTIITWNTTYVHSGKNRKEMHNIHHKIPIVNYGVLGILDKLHGTYLIEED